MNSCQSERAYLVLIVILLSLLFTGGCRTKHQDAVPVAPVTITAVTPSQNETGVAITTKITVTFSEPMDTLTINDTTFVLTCPTGTAIAGAFVYTATGDAATFSPANELPTSTICAVTITTGVKSAAGASLATAMTWTFRTTGSFCEQGFTQTDHFTGAASINGQNGWLVGTSEGFDEQVENVGVSAQDGQQVWRLSNRIISGGFSNQPLSPQLSESAGETTVRSAGGGDAMEAVFWMRPVSSWADGSAITLSFSPTGGDRQTYFRIENNLDANGGYQVRVIDYADVHTTEVFRTFSASTAMVRTAWVKVRLVMETPDGGTNDLLKVYLNDQLAGTYSTWEDYFTWVLGGNSVPIASNRLMFRVSVAPSGIDASFPDGGAQGFYLDDLCYRVYDRAAPSSTIQYYRTGFEP